MCKERFILVLVRNYLHLLLAMKLFSIFEFLLGQPMTSLALIFRLSSEINIPDGEHESSAILFVFLFFTLQQEFFSGIIINSLTVL